jgi:RhtB (resistance to homoserine/threonine) family protein
MSWSGQSEGMEINEAIAAYALAAALLTMLPGPDTAIVLVTAINAGRAAAVRAALGIGVGLIAWGTAAGLGLAAMLRASAEVYTVFKFACAAYLIWLGFTSLRAALKRRREGTPAQTELKRRFTLPWGFRQALLTAMLNPKLGVFFVAFLPQFIPPGSSAFGMTMLFSAIQATEAIVWFLVIGSLASAARTWLSRPRVRRSIAGLTGAVFVFFGVRVATD